MSMSHLTITFNRRIYRVFKFDGKCNIGDAYIMDQQSNDPCMVALFSQMVLPCIKKLNSKDTNKDLEPGIYLTEKGPFIVKPCDPEYYSVKRVRDQRYDPVDPEMVIDSSEEEISSVVSGDIFIPKMNDKDDINNKLFKVAVSLKKIALSMFSNRLGSDKYNFLRAIEQNLALSASKLLHYTNIFELQFALIIADKPNSKHPIGRPIVMFSDQEFDITNPIMYDEAKELVDNITLEAIRDDE